MAIAKLAVLFAYRIIFAKKKEKCDFVYGIHRLPKKMKVPQTIKNSIWIVVVLSIVLLNWLFIGVFLSGSGYEDLAYRNGGYIYSILIFVLLAILRALKRQTIKKDIEKLPKESEVKISNSEQWRILIYTVIKNNYLFMIFGLFEIALFFIVQYVASRQIGELLYFGSVFLFLIGFVEIAGFLIRRSKQGHPGCNMKYSILNDKIRIKTSQTERVFILKILN